MTQRASPMQTRRAAISDLDRLLGIERYFSTDRLSRANLRHLINRGNTDIWVSKESQDLTGDIVILYRRGSRNARIYSLAVDPAHRRRGIARTLLAAAEKGARARGRTAMTLEVRCDNRAALRLYELCGYRVVSRIAQFYEDGAAALKMEKMIAPGSVAPRRPAWIPVGPKSIRYSTAARRQCARLTADVT